MPVRAFQIVIYNSQMAARTVRMHVSGFQMNVQIILISVNIFQMGIQFLRKHSNSKLFQYKSDPVYVKRKKMSREECQKALNLYNMVSNVKQKNKLNKIKQNNLPKWSIFYMNGSFWPMNALFFNSLAAISFEVFRLK